MAFTANEQFSTVTPNNACPRAIPTHIQAKQFANSGGAETLAPLTLVAYNTSTLKWGVWATGGANGTGTVAGLVGWNGILLDATNDVLGNVFLGGEFHIDDIPVVGGTLAQIKTALEVARPLGFIITGYAAFP